MAVLLLCWRKSLLSRLFPPIPRMRVPPGPEMVTWVEAPEDCEVTLVTNNWALHEFDVICMNWYNMWGQAKVPPTKPSLNGETVNHNRGNDIMVLICIQTCMQTGQVPPPLASIFTAAVTHNFKMMSYGEFACICIKHSISRFAQKGTNLHDLHRVA